MVRHLEIKSKLKKSNNNFPVFPERQLVFPNSPSVYSEHQKYKKKIQIIIVENFCNMYKKFCSNYK